MAPSEWTSRFAGRFNGWIGRPLFWVAVIGFLLAAPVLRLSMMETPKPPPILSSVPPFQLTDQAGKPFGSEQLKGHVWVANFIFTRCPGVCLEFTAKMAQIQKRTLSVGPRVQLVSFSVDPEYDRPDVLGAYAREHRAQPTVWHFLTGDLADMKKIIINGLKIPMGQAPQDDLMSVAHGTHFVLVDADLKIRGYYSVSEGETVDSVARDIGLLLPK